MTKTFLKFSAIAALMCVSACDSHTPGEFRAERASALYKAAMEDYTSGRLDAAVKGFEKVLRADPGNASARFQLACLLQDRKQDYLGAVCSYREYLLFASDSDKAKLAKERLAICEKLLALEDSMGMNGRIIYSSFNHYTVTELKSLRPEARIGLLYMSMLREPWEYAVKVNAQALHPHFITLSKTPGMASECRRLGIETNVWTVNESDWMERLAKLGVTSIITNKPDLARTVIK